jgi:hypothetical protein
MLRGNWNRAFSSCQELGPSLLTIPSSLWPQGGALGSLCCQRTWGVRKAAFPAPLHSCPLDFTLGSTSLAQD